MQHASYDQSDESSGDEGIARQVSNPLIAPNLDRSKESYQGEEQSPQAKRENILLGNITEDEKSDHSQHDSSGKQLDSQQNEYESGKNQEHEGSEQNVQQPEIDQEPKESEQNDKDNQHNLLELSKSEPEAVSEPKVAITEDQAAEIEQFYNKPSPNQEPLENQSSTPDHKSELNDNPVQNSDSDDPKISEPKSSPLKLSPDPAHQSSPSKTRKTELTQSLAPDEIGPDGHKLSHNNIVEFYPEKLRETAKAPMSLAMNMEVNKTLKKKIKKKQANNRYFMYDDGISKPKSKNRKSVDMTDSKDLLKLIYTYRKWTSGK